MNDKSSPFVVRKVLPLRELIVRYIQWVADQSDGDKNVLADKLRVSVRTIYHWINKNKVDIR